MRNHCLNECCVAVQEKGRGCKEKFTQQSNENEAIRKSGMAMICLDFSIQS